MPSYCIVPSCSGSSNGENKNSKRIFHVLPKDTDMCFKWMEVIGLKDYADNLVKKRGSYRVCSDHFEESSYEVKRVLLKTALPTLLLRGSDRSAKSSATKTKTKAKTEHEQGTSVADSHSSFSVANMQIKAEVIEPVVIDEHTLRVEITRRTEIDSATATPVPVPGPSTSEEFLKYSRKINPKTLKLITCQMLMKNNDKRKPPVKYKQFCLDLYYHNPKAYGFLQQFMRLPPIPTLRNIHLNAQAGYISPHCLRVLEMMVSKMSAKDKCCIVGIGSTMLKKHVYYDISNDKLHGLHQIDDKQWRKPAKKAYAIVVKGLLSKWQLPVAYALYHDNDVKTLTYWADSVIRMLLQKGLDVRAFVSNQDDADLKRVSELRKISSSKNSFVLSNKTIYNIFDARYLVTSLRNRLMRIDMSITGKGVATWEHILTFYNTEVEQQTGLAAGVTHAHFYPDAIQQKSTELAVQLFSKSTATAMRLFYRLKLLDESALATVSLIDRVSEAYDLLNSDTVKHDSWYKRALTGEELQENFLKEVTEYFEGIKFKTFTNGVSVNRKIEPIVGFIVTIKSVHHLWKDLSDDGCSHLLTRSLNLEFVEDFFREIYSHDKNRKHKCDQITTIQFIRAFNKSFINHVIKNSRLNSSKKLKSSMAKLNEYFAKKDEEPDKEPEETKLLLIDLDHKISLPEQNVLRFIAGYLMTQVLEKHSCKTLMLYLHPSVNCGSKIYLEFEYLERGSEIPKILHLPVEFILFVVKLEHEFVKVFQCDVIPREVGTNALKAMGKLVLLPCSCFPLFLVKKLFVRMRIYNGLKYINRQLKTNDVFEMNAYDL